MLDRKIGITGKEPEHGAPTPAASKARVEIETTVDQPYGDVDVLTIPCQHEGGWCEYLRVVRGGSKCPSSEIDSRTPVRLTIVRPAVDVELSAQECIQGEGRTVMWIAVDRPSEQVEYQGVPVTREGKLVRKSAQIEIIGREIARRSRARSAELGCL